ncbi:hypothetical protein FOCC_FOCC006539 [Frankliniella occidentalis]|nr:hypothetical protein FOCC_FOCC006539 [Frankliniella occidentalis]
MPLLLHHGLQRDGGLLQGLLRALLHLPGVLGGRGQAGVPRGRPRAGRSLPGLRPRVQLCRQHRHQLHVQIRAVRSARERDLPGLHLRGRLQLQPVAALHWRRVRRLQDHLALLGGRGQARARAGQARGRRSVRPMCQRALLRCPCRARLHGQIRPGLHRRRRRGLLRLRGPAPPRRLRLPRQPGPGVPGQVQPLHGAGGAAQRRTGQLEPPTRVASPGKFPENFRKISEKDGKFPGKMKNFADFGKFFVYFRKVF